MVVDLSNNAWVIDAANQLAPVFIAPQDTASAASGDAVIAQLLPRNDGKLVGKVLKITERAPPPRQLQNRLLIDSAENFYIQDTENANKPVFITPPDLNAAEKGDLVLVQLHPVWRKDAPTSGTLLLFLQCAVANMCVPIGKVLKILEKAPKEFGGIVAIDQKNHAWITDPQKKAKAIYVAAEDLNGALHGDAVLAALNPPRADGNVTAKVVTILKRAQQPRELTAKYAIDQKGNGWAIDNSDKSAKPIYIPPADASDAQHGDLVLVRAAPPRADGSVVGKILSVLERAPKPYERTAVINVDQKGHAWALDNSDKTAKPVFVPTADLNSAQNGDMVTVLVYPPREDGAVLGKVLPLLQCVANRAGVGTASIVACGC